MLVNQQENMYRPPICLEATNNPGVTDGEGFVVYLICSVFCKVSNFHSEAVPKFHW